MSIPIKNKIKTTASSSSKLSEIKKNQASNSKKKIQRQRRDLPRASTSNNAISDADEVSSNQEVLMKTEPPAAEIATNSSCDRHGMQKVFSYLDTKDLVNVQRICKTWANIAANTPRKSVSVKGLKIIDWEAFASFLKVKRTLYLNITGILETESINWEKVISFLAKTSVKEITFNNCTAVIAEQITRSCMKLQLSFECESISVVLKKIISTDDQRVDQTNITFTEVSFESDEGFNAIGNIASLLGLSCLTHLEIESVKELKPHQLSEGIKLNTLRFVREENKCPRISFNIPEGIFSLENIECLQLINFGVADNFHDMLRKCTRLKSLVLNPVSYTVSSNDKILEGIINVKDHLESLTWALSIQRIRKAKNLLGKRCQGDDQSDIEFMPISERISNLFSTSINNPVINQEKVSEYIEPKKIPINFYPLGEVEKLLKNKLPNLAVSILKTDRFRSAASPDLHESL